MKMEYRQEGSLNPPASKLEELFSHETLMALQATNKYENAIQAEIKIQNTKYQNPNDKTYLKI